MEINPKSKETITTIEIPLGKFSETIKKSFNWTEKDRDIGNIRYVFVSEVREVAKIEFSKKEEA